MVADTNKQLEWEAQVDLCCTLQREYNILKSKLKEANDLETKLRDNL